MIVFKEVLIPDDVKLRGLRTTLLFAELYLTTIVVLIPGLTSTLISSPLFRLWFCFVVIVAIFFSTFAVSWSSCVSKLWKVPVPMDVK